MYTEQEAAAMILNDESDTDWNDSEEELSDSENTNNSLLQAQEDMADPLQTAQEMLQDEDIDNDHNGTTAHSVTTSSPCQQPSTSVSNPAPVHPLISVSSSSGVCQQPHQFFTIQHTSFFKPDCSNCMYTARWTHTSVR